MPVMTEVRPRCDRTDLHQDECSHCRRDDDGTPAVFLAHNPAAPRPERWHPPTRTIRPAATPAPSPLTARYPVLCAAECRTPEHGGPRQAGGRSHLCPVCEDRTRDDLTAVADAWPDLEARLTAIKALWGADFITGDRAGTGLVLDEPASAAMREASMTAHFYVRIVMRERGHTPENATPPGLIRWLARNHVPWLAAHPDPDVATAFAADAADLARQARNAAYPAGWRTIPLPLDCHVQLEAEPDAPTIPCPGRMTARIRPDLAQVPDLVCDRDPAHRVPPDVWQRHGWKHAARNEAATRRFIEHVRTS